jgi:hypothetical protein
MNCTYQTLEGKCRKKEGFSSHPSSLDQEKLRIGNEGLPESRNFSVVKEKYLRKLALRRPGYKVPPPSKAGAYIQGPTLPTKGTSYKLGVEEKPLERTIPNIQLDKPEKSLKIKKSHY